MGLWPGLVGVPTPAAVRSAAARSAAAARWAGGEVAGDGGVAVLVGGGEVGLETIA